LLDQLPACPQLEALDDDFRSIYAVYGTRRFLFQLDARKTGRIRILDLMQSTALSEFMLMQQTNAALVTATNWFSVDYVTRIHASYINLDTDQNGLLSKAEFGKYNSGYLTSLVIDRIFQECTSYDGEIDYKVYLDFVLAREYPKTPQVRTCVMGVERGADYDEDFAFRLLPRSNLLNDFYCSLSHSFFGCLMCGNKAIWMHTRSTTSGRVFWYVLRCVASVHPTLHDIA
jgi:hypothetical protein